MSLIIQETRVLKVLRENRHPLIMLIAVTLSATCDDSNYPDSFLATINIEKDWAKENAWDVDEDDETVEQRIKDYFKMNPVNVWGHQ